jgi:DNA-directed RNA polymerase specialized sigma24 family protein
MKPSGFSADSLAEVFRCRRSELVRLGAFILGDRQAAEDVVQDVFLRVHQRRERLDDLDDPFPYLRGAVVNGCRSVLRRRLLIRRHAGKDQPCPPLSAEEAMLLSEDRRQVPRRRSPPRSASAPAPSSRQPREAWPRWPAPSRSPDDHPG